RARGMWTILGYGYPFPFHFLIQEYQETEDCDGRSLWVGRTGPSWDAASGRPCAVIGPSGRRVGRCDADRIRGVPPGHTHGHALVLWDLTPVRAVRPVRWRGPRAS